MIKKQFISFLAALCLASGALFAQSECDGVRYKDEIFTNIKSTKDVVYGQNKTWDGTLEDLKIDIYMPDETDEVAARPVILWAHGGSFVGGDKSATEVVQFCEAFAKRGFVTGTISYRLGFNFGAAAGGGVAAKNELFKAAIRATQDGKAAVRYFRKSAIADGNPYKIDPERIYFAGSSAGAFIALHLSYLNTPDEFAQMADLSILDELGGLEGESGNPGYSSKAQVCINLCGALGLADWVDVADNVPHIGMHGTADAVVPYKKGTAGVSIILVPVEGTFEVDSVAQAKGVPSDFHTWYGADHVPYADNPSPARELYRDSTIAFVSENLYPYVCSVTGIAEKNKLAASPRVSPNPATGAFILRPSDDSPYFYRVLDATGREIVRSESVGEKRISTEDWAPGVYMVSVQNHKVSSTQKIIVR